MKNLKVDVRFKIAALWLIYMFVYIYTDFYNLYVSGKIQAMMDGMMEGIKVTQMSLLGVAAITIIPALMIFLTLILNEKANRLLNIIVGVLHMLIGVANLMGSIWFFYMFYGVLMFLMAGLIVFYAWKWPINLEKQRAMDKCHTPNLSTY